MWEKVVILGVAGAIVITVLWITGSADTVPVVVGGLLALLAAVNPNNRPGAGKNNTQAGQSRDMPNPETDR